MERKTLREHGSNLSIGLPDPNGGLLKPFSTRRFSHKDNKALAARRDDAVTAGRFASEVIKMFVTDVAGFKLGETSEGERSLFVNRLSMADAFTLYFGVRITAKGPIIKPRLRCPMCKFAFSDTVDLYSTIMRIITDPTELEREFKFSETYTVEIAKGREVTFDRVTLGPPMWSEIEGLTPEKFDNTAIMTEAIIRGAIKRLGDLSETDTRLALSSNALDMLSLLDIDDLTEDINNNAPGPELVIDTKCKRCKSKITTPLDWSYDSFFGTSSRSRD